MKTLQLNSVDFRLAVSHLLPYPSWRGEESSLISQTGLNHQGPMQKTPVFVCLQGAELLSEKDLKRVAKPEELKWDL